MNELSHAIRRAAARWMFVELRAQAVAEEFSIGGRTADAVGLFTKSRRARPRVSAALDALHGLTPPTPAVEVVIVEVKISRDDFLGGLRKGQIANDGTGLGNYADKVYIAAPPDTVPLAMLPSGWGLLLYRAQSNGGVILDVALRPKRLSPAHTTWHEGLADRLAQSTWWRFYSYGTDVTYRKDRFNPETFSYDRREIVLADDGAAGAPR